MDENSENKDKVKFKDISLTLYKPSFDSELTSIIIELEKLRVKKLGGPVPPYIFFQLKEIFQILESLGSARIEGNNTTLAEFIEKVIENSPRETRDEKLREIYNIDRAIGFIEKNVDEQTTIDRALISEVHKIIVDGLTPPPNGEGSRYPGILRPINVTVQKSSLIPPDHTRVPDYFQELLSFTNQKIDSKYDLLITALSHHRMAWIHPFDNGNGRLIRMFTYALLIKQGFKVKDGRILNPTAIFCMDRNKYYDMLALADTGKEENILQWCTYVLQGLLKEIEKIDRLLNLDYMTNEILLPVLSHALDRRHITARECEVLRAVVKNKGMIIKSADLKSIIGGSAIQRSRVIKKLREKNMLLPLEEKGRKYTIGFVNNYLLRGISHILEEKSFIPEFLTKSK
ncbi:MAG: Fic family protein [Candidatus Manganitrophus sp. SB1]|nr:Fic family protein [Candidatus Manganitrophus morganii]